MSFLEFQEIYKKDFRANGDMSGKGLNTALEYLNRNFNNFTTVQIRECLNILISYRRNINSYKLHECIQNIIDYNSKIINLDLLNKSLDPCGLYYRETDITDLLLKNIDLTEINYNFIRDVLKNTLSSRRYYTLTLLVNRDFTKNIILSNLSDFVLNIFSEDDFGIRINFDNQIVNEIFKILSVEPQIKKYLTSKFYKHQDFFKNNFLFKQTFDIYFSDYLC